MLDQEGVGELMRIAVERARGGQARAEDGHLRRARRRAALVSRSATASGLDYVSCSPYRVPLARLAAAQAVLEEKTAAKTGD